MTDKKITELTELTDINDEDLIYIVDDPGVTPVGKKITAANLFKRAGARVYNSGDTSINHATATSLTFDTQRYDTDGIHSLIANTSRLTCQTAGKYVINGNIRWAANAVGSRIIIINLNGITGIAQIIINTTIGAAKTDMNITTIYDLAVSDYVELQVYQDSGGALDCEANSNKSPEFMMQRIG